MQQTIDNAKRGFLKWICRLTGGYLFLSLSPAPLKRINATLFSEAHGQTGCNTDTCTTRDACEGDSVGHTCSVKDTCDVDQSGDCTNDTCTLDSSLNCKNDACESDSSGSCDTDSCSRDSSGGCTGDQCESDSSRSCTNDSCTSDSSGACTNDSCLADSSGDCAGDTCISDSSGSCTNDSCTSDKSGICTNDFCLSDASGDCQTDWCRTDSSGPCENDTCIADSSGACVSDACDSDSATSCDSDACVSDSSGACGFDQCNQDSSGACTVRDICIIDKSGSCDIDLCRVDSNLDCTTSDTCALDMVSGMRSRQQTLASKSINRAMKWLYNLTTVILCILTASLAHGQDTAVIDAINAIFFPNPTFITAAPVSVDQPVGAFLRDCDGDGVLEADTNGDGHCAGDPKVMDHRGIGTRELPPGTSFTGTFKFTCFHIPEDVAIISTGPLNIAVSREVAIFGAMKLSNGINITTPVDIDTRLSTWLSDAGGIILSTALTGYVYNDRIALTDGQNLPSIQYASICDATGMAVRAIIPPEVTQGSIVTIKGSNLGMSKGKVAIGTINAKVKTWTPDSITAEFKKVPVVTGPYNSVVTPKKATAITTVNAYQVVAPSILSVVPEGGYEGDSVTVQGRFFGKKKGKLTIGDKKCKVVAWTMDARTGASEAKFVVPKKLAPGTYALTITNTVGLSTIYFEVYELPTP